MRKYSTRNLILIAALLLSACSFDTPAAPASVSTEQPVQATEESSSNVTITFGAIGFMRHAYEPLMAAFKQQHPNITVQFVALDGVYQGTRDYNQQTRQIVSRADTAAAGASEEQFNQGLLRDLKPLIDTDTNFTQDDFYPSALSSATSNSGAIYKLPATLEVPLLFYNKDLLAARGVSEPKPDWTWQDMRATAQQLAQKQGDIVKVYGLADEDIYLAVLLDELRGAGLDLLTTPPASASVDRPEVAQALERIAQLFKSGAFYDPPPGSDFRNTVAPMILGQQVAMWGSTIAENIAQLQKQAGGSSGASTSFALGAAPFPPFPGGTRNFADGYIMSSGTQHPQEAWAWLSFLSRQLIVEQGSKGGPADSVSILPARKSLAEQSGYWSHLDEQTNVAIQTAMSQLAPASVSDRNAFDAYQPLIQAVQDIIGGKPAAQAASAAQAAITEQSEQVQQTPAVTPNPQPIVVATPAPSVAAPGATKITFGMPLGKGSDRAAEFVQQFNQANPAVFVQLKDTFTGSGILTIPESATQTDCFASPLPATADLTATLDLQPLLDADASFPRDDYPAALLTAYQHSGHLHGLPWGITFRAVVYNKDLFDAAGLAAPAPSWTIDEFINTAQRLTSGSGDTRQYGFVIPRSTSEGVKFLVHLFGASLVQGSGETLRPSYTDSKVLEAARKVVDLLKRSSPHARLNDYSQTGQQIDLGNLTGQGRSGMWFAWGMYAYGQAQPKFAMAIAPPPLGQSVLDTDDLSTTSLYVSASTDKQQACWTWLRALSATTLDGIAGFPARRSVAQSDTTNQAMPGAAETYQAYMQALERVGQLSPGDQAFSTPLIDYYWFYRAIDRALQGKNLQQELAAAQALTEQYVACVRSSSQRAAEACDRQVDPNYGQF